MPPAPVYRAPVAPVQPPRFEPEYTQPRIIERHDPIPQEAPKKVPSRPKEREYVPQDNFDEHSDRNRIGRAPKLPSPDDFGDDHPNRSRKNKAPRVQDEFGDEYAQQPWNKPAAKGVPPCATPIRPSVCSHKVEPGETLTSIALQHYGCGGPRTVARIAAVNPGVHPDRIYVGQIVYLPCACGINAAPEPERETVRRRSSPSNRPACEAAQYIPISAL